MAEIPPSGRGRKKWDDWLKGVDLHPVQDWSVIHSAERADTPIVYHYTNATGLLGIISSGSLWASDVTFLNDSNELAYAAAKLQQILSDEAHIVELYQRERSGYLRKYPSVIEELRSLEKRRDEWTRHRRPEDETGALKALHSIIRDLRHMIAPAGSPPLYVYVTCFCKDGDLLSQWRGYGGVGGYAVGFCSEALRERVKEYPMGRFDRVCYGFDHAVHWDRQLFPEYLHSGITLLGDYLNALAMIKNPSFKEEQEWRLMIPRMEVHKDLQFRASPVGISPFLPVSFVPDAVAEVIVGPGHYPRERVKGTRQLLARYGYDAERVALSKSSLRG